jgi:hypothetical protein
MTYDQIGKLLLLAGVVAVVAGLVFILLGRTPLGRLPGDITFSSGPVTCFMPLATMLVVSLLLTVVINVVLRLFNR